MEPEAAEVCTFCAGLIPPKEEPSPSRAHHPSMGLIEQSSQTCSICKVLLADWSLEKTQRRFPDMDKETYESIVLKVKLKEIQRVGSALSWAILETNFGTRGFTFIDFFSITTCNTKCGLTIYLLLNLR
jgi:hypothetical protein